MKILFVHQNFPGQFKNLAPNLSALGHNVKALYLGRERKVVQGIEYIPYQTSRATNRGIHPWVIDFETKVIRADACYRVATQMRADGYVPDVIVAHHGWGESLFLNEVWPSAPLGIYCEFFYKSTGADVNFDPEFRVNDPSDVCRLRLKNLTNLLHFDIATQGISPTHWQASVFPEEFQHKLSVIHDGIDTSRLMPNHNASVRLPNGQRLTKNDEVVTFVARNLEPYRGFHMFMRALPRILRRRPSARIVIVGGDSVSYGPPPKDELSWKQKFIKEVRSEISDEDWGRVYFLGQIQYEGLVALFQITSAHVYLTYPFVLSWSMLEAMACGAPLVASATKPVEEVVTDNVNGLLVDFFSPDDLASAIENLLTSRSKAADLGSAARQTVKDQYDLASICLPKQMTWLACLRETRF